MTGVTDARRAPRMLPGLALPSPGLTLLVAVISILASLDLSGASVLARTASEWSERLTGSATIVTGGRDLESADAAAARAVEILGRAGGVADVRVLDPATVDMAAGRVLGLTPSAPSTAPPRMLSVRFRPGSAMTAAQATDLLRRQGLAAAGDDHGPWTGPIERRGLFAAGAVGAIFLAVLASHAALTGAVITAAVRRLRERLGLLVQLGADTRALARPFRDHAIVSATAGAMLGSAIVVVMIAVLAFEPAMAIRLSAWLPGLPPIKGLDVIMGALWIPLAVVIAAGTGWMAARGAIRPLT